MIKMCRHCQGTKYVLDYQLERLLYQCGLDVSTMSPMLLKQIPVEVFQLCHCSALIFSPNQRQAAECLSCGGIRWKLTDAADQEFGCGIKVTDLSPSDIIHLDCSLIERCICDVGDQFPPRHKKKIFSDVLDVLRQGIPNLRLNY